MSANAWFFCIAGGVLLVLSVVGTLVAPRALAREAEPPARRGTMPPWAVAVFGLALASFALAIEWPGLAVFVAAPFLLMWLLGGRRAPPRANPVTPAAVLASLPPEVQSALASERVEPPRIPDFTMLAPPPTAAPVPAAPADSAPTRNRVVLILANLVFFAATGRVLLEPDWHEEDPQAIRRGAILMTFLAIVCAGGAMHFKQEFDAPPDRYSNSVGPGLGMLAMAFFAVVTAVVALVRWFQWLARRYRWFDES